ncbi:MAG: hypothetical protein AAFX87_09005 [Bacteroidota bacterium]
MVEVFKTSIENDRDAQSVRTVLKKYFGYSNIAFDLQDCDRILRIEACEISSNSVINKLKKIGVECVVLPD